jgi:predicted metal-dependent phosphoesterase TrpH
MKKYDLHIHTKYSECSFNKPEKILERAKRIGLNGIAITDHNAIKGALEAKKLNKDKDFEVITGEEIQTECGEILALYLKKEIKPGKLDDIIKEAKKQDAILIVPHPYRIAPWTRFKCPLEELSGKVDAIETFNSRNIGAANKKAEKMANGMNFAKIGASDSHLIADIGKGYTLFEGCLREAIKKRKTIAKGTTKLAIFSVFVSTINKRVLCLLGVKRKW